MNENWHDDVIKWKHFPRYWPFFAGNSPVTGEFPAQRPVTLSFDVFFDLRLNKRWSKQCRGWWFEAPSCPWWRHCIDMHSALVQAITWCPNGDKSWLEPLLSYQHRVFFPVSFFLVTHLPMLSTSAQPSAIHPNFHRVSFLFPVSFFPVPLFRLLFSCFFSPVTFFTGQNCNFFPVSFTPPPLLSFSRYLVSYYPFPVTFFPSIMSSYAVTRATLRQGRSHPGVRLFCRWRGCLIQEISQTHTRTIHIIYKYIYIYVSISHMYL